MTANSRFAHKIISVILAVALAIGIIFPTPNYHIRPLSRAEALVPALPWMVKAFWALAGVVAGLVVVGTAEQQTGLISEAYTEFCDWCQTEKGITKNQIDSILLGTKQTDGTLSLLNIDSFNEWVFDWATTTYTTTVTDSSLAVPAVGNILTIGNGISFYFSENPNRSAQAEILSVLGVNEFRGSSDDIVATCYTHYAGRAYSTADYKSTSTITAGRILFLIKPDSTGNLIVTDNANNSVVPNSGKYWGSNNYTTSYYYSSNAFSNIQVSLYGGDIVGSITGDTFTATEYGITNGYGDAAAISLNGAGIGRLDGATGYVDSETKSMSIYIPDTEEQVITYPDITTGAGVIPTDTPAENTDSDFLAAILAGILSGVASITDALEGVRFHFQEWNDITPSVALSNLTSDIGSKFPFCIPSDIYTVVAKLGAEPEAPIIEFDFEPPGIEPYHVELDLSDWEPAAQTLRTMLTLALFIGLAWLAVSYLGLINGGKKGGGDD